MAVSAPMWDDLRAMAARAQTGRIVDLFADPNRAADFSARMGGLLFDYSKTSLNRDARAALFALCDAAGLAARRDAMFAGERVNETESRAVLHTALRDPDGPPLVVNGADIRVGIRDSLAKMTRFANDLRAGVKAGQGGAFADVVNIGIGGSHLGPAMAVRALAPFADGPRVHFVSNIDGADIHDTLRGLDPARTLVIIASKTFTTIETMCNAKAACDWLRAAVGADGMGAHLVALSSATDKTAAFGIPPDHVFGFEDWVGGRYSIWGPIGLGLMLAIGPERFAQFLQGGLEMDTHFRTASWDQNLPVLLALTGIWHHQGCGYPTRAVLPYEERLSLLPAYLQQLEMESNGKSVAMDGSALGVMSGPVVWGAAGTNGQHAFYQLIHQGTQIVPCEFMVGRRGHEPALTDHHRLLIANCLAQSESLMRGRSLDEARAMLAHIPPGDERERQARHRVFAGNRPSVTLTYPRLDPHVLGQIVALYEHRVFVEGVLLGINSFDQWGVELGKERAVALAPWLAADAAIPETLDGSTRQLLAELQEG